MTKRSSIIKKHLMKSPIFFLLGWSLVIVSGLSAQTEYKVYPGDTNNDGIVNVRDLLPIGLAFGREVNARADMDIDWTAKLAIDSLGLFLPNTLVNYVHINSNGDRLINAADMDAIRLNYDSTITDELPPAWAPEMIAPVSYCPELKIYFDRDTAFLQDTFFAEIWLEFPVGQEVAPADGILGLSFAFRYPLDNIDDQATEIIPNTEDPTAEILYVTANAQTVALEKVVPPGRGDVAAAGRGFNVFLQSLLICKVGIVVEDMIFRSPADRPFWIDILPESVLMINDREERFEFCLPPPDTIILSDRISGIKDIDANASLRLWPNPSTGSFELSLPAKAERISLLDPTGQLCWQQDIPALKQLSVHLPDLPAGSYFLLIESREKTYRKRLILIR